MPQQISPMIPRGATEINETTGVIRDDFEWRYFLGPYIFFKHAAGDQKGFRFATSSLIANGICRPVEIIKTFGVSKSSVNRYLRLYRTEGIEGFYQKPVKTERRGRVLTPEKLQLAQNLLDRGLSRQEIADEIGIKRDTLRKAINDSRLRETNPSCHTSTKSDRSVDDTQAADGMGTACTRPEERTLAAFGVCDGAPVRFETCLDVPNGGVLCALPALLMNGLLEGADQFLGKLKGYYHLFHILLLLAFMALARIKTVEELRGYPPGEFGKLLGLDRIPEVRCLRNKMDDLSSDNAAEIWSMHMAEYWMMLEPDAVGTLYIDGHVRVYHGRLTKLPRRYVSRERLCLRGTSDYWVNDAIGRPFFVISKGIDPGLLKTLEEDIVPRLLEDVPYQPEDEELAANPNRCRFLLVFDREGYSPVFFRKMWENHRIACMTYHKHPGEDWSVDLFDEETIHKPNGEILTMRLAEKESLVGSGKMACRMREVRKLTESGHQTSIITTAFDIPHTVLAASMFSRWCQENFFRYMKKHYAIDLLSEYGAKPFPDTEKVVNPKWRELNGLRNSVQNKLRYRRAKFAALLLEPEHAEGHSHYQKWLRKKAELLEEIQNFEHQLNGLKKELKATQKHILWGDLEEKDRFYKLLPGRKLLMDTIRMTAYRAETAMAGLLLETVADFPAARRIVQDLLATSADILPEPENKVLRIRIHGASRPVVNRCLSVLFDNLNEAGVKYPGTELTLIYELNHKDDF